MPSVAEEQVDRVSQASGIRTVAHLSANFRRLIVNCSRPALDDVRVRRALAEAIDWDRIDRTVYHNRNARASSDILPTSGAAPQIPLLLHHPGGARRLLALPAGKRIFT